MSHRFDHHFPAFSRVSQVEKEIQNFGVVARRDP